MEWSRFLSFPFGITKTKDLISILLTSLRSIHCFLFLFFLFFLYREPPSTIMDDASSMFVFASREWHIPLLLYRKTVRPFGAKITKNIDHDLNPQSLDKKKKTLLAIQANASLLTCFRWCATMRWRSCLCLTSRASRRSTASKSGIARPEGSTR